MSVLLNKNAVVVSSALSSVPSIRLSQLFSVTPSASNPAYLLLNGLDRNEYTAAATGATGTLSGNGQTASMTAYPNGDNRGVGIVFAYDAASGRYYNSAYGYLDQMTYMASASADDLTDLSLYGFSDPNLAAYYATVPYVGGGTYLGTVSIATELSFGSTVPTQATPASVAVVADTFAGTAWNKDGCWTLASTISTEAGAALPVVSSLTGVAGQANGEWMVAFNGPAGQSGDWQSMVTEGDIVVIPGHITTCVSGSGSTAMLIDNITDYYNGQIINLANDGSSNDVVVQPPHPAAYEWTGVPTSSVVIYRLDTPVVTETEANASMSTGGTLLLQPIFSATDSFGKAVTDYQIYNIASGDNISVNGATVTAHSAASADTVTSLNSVCLASGVTGCNDTVEVRAFNGTYWGDWAALNVAVNAPTRPVLAAPTQYQYWAQGSNVSFVLPPGTFTDPRGEALTYSASLANSPSMPAWLTFNAATQTFSGIVPAGMQRLWLSVTATDTSGLSASEFFQVIVPAAAPVPATTIAPQQWTEGQQLTLPLPPNMFTDPQDETLSYSATLSNGQPLPNWLACDPTTGTLSGTVPYSAGSLSINLIATDSSGLSASDTFTATVQAPAPTVTDPTPNQPAWTAGYAAYLPLAADTFTAAPGQILTYSATLANGQPLPAGLNFNPSTLSFGGSVPFAIGTYTIKVTATQTNGLSASETFQITDTASAPVLNVPIVAMNWIAGLAQPEALPANMFTDPQGEKLSYTATLSNGQPLPAGLTFDPSTLTFSTTSLITGFYTVKLTAIDQSGLSVSDTLYANIQAYAPTVTDPTPNQPAWTAGYAAYLPLAADTFTAAPGQILTYSATLANGQPLPAGLNFNPSTLSFGGSVPFAIGTYTIKVTATQTNGLSASETFQITDTASAPVLHAQIASQFWKAGQAASLAPPANLFTDPQNEKLTYIATLSNGQPLPAGLTFNPSTLTFGTTSLASGTYAIRLTATDQSGLSTSDMFTATIQASAPKVTDPTPNQPAWTAGYAAYLPLAADTFTAAPGQTLTYSAMQANGAALPAGLNFNPYTLSFGGSVPFAIGTYTIKVTATQTNGLSASETFQIVDTASAPVLNVPMVSLNWMAAGTGLARLPANMFTDPQGQTLTYTATLSNGQPLPAGLIFNPSTLIFSTAPPISGTYTVKLTATDQSGLSTSDMFTATIQASAPTVTDPTPNQPAWTAGYAVGLTLAADTFSAAPGQTLTYAAMQANGAALPAGLNFNPYTLGFGGSVPFAIGTYTIKVTATQTNGLSASETFQIMDTAAAPVAHAQIANQFWKAGQAASLALPANLFTDPQSEKLTYIATLSNGQPLPAGLTFNPSTLTFGTTSLASGTYAIRLTATDQSGLSTSDMFTATIQASAPKVNIQMATQIWLPGKAVTLALPSNTFVDPQGEKLTYTATQSNGAALPSGLSFNSATDSFTGTAPTTPETLGLKVTATNTSGLSASEAFSINVQPSVPILARQTTNQVWTDRSAMTFILPTGTFSDPQGSALTYTAYETGGANQTSWMHYNPTLDEFTGTVPAALTGTIGVQVVATDGYGLSASETFGLTFAPTGTHFVSIPAAPSATEKLAFHTS